MRESFLDSFSVYDKNSGSYCEQAHKKCPFKEKCIGPRNKLQPLDNVDKYIKNSQEDCLYCLEPLAVKNHRDTVRDHCHVSGKYREAAHSACNLQLRIRPEQDPIPMKNMK